MSAGEYAAFIASAPSGVPALVIPEAREHPVKMQRQLPARWWQSNTKRPAFLASVAPGENFTFQLAVYNHNQHGSGSDGDAEVRVTSIAFSELIPGAVARAMHFQGVDFWGNDWKADSVGVSSGAVKSFWVGVVVPSTALPGVYNGTATVTIELSSISSSRTRSSSDSGTSADAAAAAPYTIDVAVSLTVVGAAIPNGGDDDPTRGTRLHWLDSRVGGGDDGKLPPPFTPLQIVSVTADGLSLSMLGKKATIGTSGMPTSITVRTLPHCIAFDAPHHYLAS